jgi:hypothetical protein
MRLSFWQFALLLLAIIAAFYFYNLWWSKQNQKDWSKRFNKYAVDSEVPGSEDGASDNSQDNEQPVERDENGWIK